MKRFTSLPVIALCGASLALSGSGLAAENTPKKSPQKSARNSSAKASSKTAQLPKPAYSASASMTPPPSTRFVSMATIKRLQKQHDSREMVVAIQPFLDGQSLKGKDMSDLATNPPLVVVEGEAREADSSTGAAAGAQTGERSETMVRANSLESTRLAQAFPAVRPATPRPGSTAKPVIPRWVRYPLEFQLCGIGLGMKAVDKDRFNRIDRYGLFAIHGNPTAVVVPTSGGTTTVYQQPPEVAALFSDTPGGGMEAWAQAITVQLDNNHVEWLYRRDTYSMGFIVDRLGYVDAIVVAGTESPIAKTQLEDPVHTVKLGDDLRKVLFRYGYPDTLETYNINAIAGVSVGDAGANGAQAGGQDGQPNIPDQPGAAPGAAAAGAAAGTQGAANSAFRTFEVRYEQSYNIVFTIRNNRVIRMYIFGDPDFFNQQRREALRTQY